MLNAPSAVSNYVSLNVLGFSSQGILVSGDDENGAATDFNAGSGVAIADFDPVSSVLSVSGPLPPETVTFSATGNYAFGAPTRDTYTYTYTNTASPTEQTIQNTSGPLALWQMSGTTIVGGGQVALEPGPTWDAKAPAASSVPVTRPSSGRMTGSVALWDMSGTQRYRWRSGRSRSRTDMAHQGHRPFLR